MQILRALENRYNNSRHALQESMTLWAYGQLKWDERKKANETQNI